MNSLYIDSTSTWGDAENIYTNYNNSESGYFVMELEPENLPSSQDSGICVTEADNSSSDDLENRSSISCDSGYISASVNVSMNSSLTTNNFDDYQSVTLTQPQKPLKEMSCFSKFEYLFDDTIGTVNVQEPLVAGPATSQPPTIFKTTVKIQKPGHPNIFSQKRSHSAASANKPIGHYARKPVYLQSKSVVNSAVHTASRYAPIAPSPSPPTSSIVIGIDSTKSISCSSNTKRKRKAQHVLKVDEYRHEDLKPTQELLAARRLLDEALIAGNIVSQARYARINSGLQLTSLKVAQSSNNIDSFKKKTETTVSLLPVQETETKPNVDDTFPRSSRVLYQGNRRLDNCKFTWKIGYNGPRQSFNKVAVKRTGRKNHKRGHKPLGEVDNRNKKRRRLF